MLVRERVRVGEESIRRALSDIVERVGMAQAAFREAVALFRRIVTESLFGSGPMQRSGRQRRMQRYSIHVIR